MRHRRLIFTLSALAGVLATVSVAGALGGRNGVPANGPGILAATALGDAVTYQGRLLDGGNPADGEYDVRFILYDADAGGVQAGVTVTKENVAVANGLFSTQLDFGPGVFTGQGRWLEVAVRPGASGGSFIVLSPRQPVSANPYALYSKRAGAAVALEFPFAGAGNTVAATPLFSLDEAGPGSTLFVKRSFTGATVAPALQVMDAAAGGAIWGEATNTAADTTAIVGRIPGAGSLTGIGGRFEGPTGVKAQGTGAAPVALELNNGALKVSGATPAAFIHTVDAGGGASDNVCNGASFDHITIINNPLTNGQPNAILLVTVNRLNDTGASIPGAGVFYDTASGPDVCAAGDRWVIYSLDGFTLADGATFNVLVISQ